jgi:4-amino-4-deoxy-L-arabinose transferase-like glycosyltransferase
MQGLLISLALVVVTGIIIALPAQGAPALLLCGVVACAVGYVIRRMGGGERSFLLYLFVGALLVRLVIASIIFGFHQQEFFGGDALAYDNFGYALLRVWHGDVAYKDWLGGEIDTFWGMPYYVASIYALVGRNPLAVQFINSIMGAATAPAIYLCARQIFNNQLVARFTGLLTGFFPSLVLWSAQGLKDGPVVFMLAVAMLATLKLGERLSVKYFVLLVAALLGLLSLRFYIFYMMLIAIGGAFIIGMRQLTAQNLFRQMVLIVGVGLALTYWGVLRTANAQLANYGSLESVQSSRADLTGGSSGFAKDVDVSTAGGALSVIPLGLLYLLFAPFPWQVANLRQSITLPEMIVWWSLFPLLVLGLWFTLKYRLRPALPILLFTTMLTLGYSIFQGNVGTAYRQRAQLLIFYFMFVAVGYVLLKERNDERREQQRALRQRRPWE